MPNQSDPNTTATNTQVNPEPVKEELPAFMDPSVSTNPVSDVPQANQQPSPTIAESKRPAFLTVEEAPADTAASTPNVISQTQSTPPPPVNPDPPNSSFVVNPNSGNSGKGKKAVAILAIVGLVAATAIGVLAVGSNRLQQSSAWDCDNYNFNVSSSGEVRVTNGSSRNEPIQKADVFIDGNKVITFDVPALAPGETSTLGTVAISSNTFTWEVIGTLDCRDGGSYLASPTPGLNQISCSSVKAFDTDWQELNSSQLSNLKPGETVRFTVIGTATNGTFDQARFTINGTQLTPVTQKRPGSNEFYEEYTISDETNTINVTAQVHHVETNNWY